MAYLNVQDRNLPFALRYLADLMAYRHLCWNLVASDLRSRFRRTKLGILWAILQPLGFALLIAAVWGGLSNAPNYWEYAVYVLSGMVLFEFFTAGLSGGQSSLQSAVGFIKQARVPLFVFQLRVVLTGATMFLFGLLTTVILATAIGAPPQVGLHLLLVPAFVFFAVLFVLPVAMIMSIVGVLYRDVQHISQLAERAIFFISPIMLPRETFEAPQLRFMEVVNPLVPLMDMFRDPLLHGRLWEAQDVIVVSIWIAALWAIALVTVGSVGRKIVFSL